MRRAPAELTVVMPVFNEEQAIDRVIRSWTRELDRLDIGYELRVYDDGSVDQTKVRLASLASEFTGVTAVTQSNQGHGPTVLRGYREASSPWIFQVDSDGEMAPDDFETLWTRRHESDLITGWRRQRQSSMLRRRISAAARWTVRRAFGSAASFHDVNCPYRLWRQEKLKPLLLHLPPGTLAPNVALSGLAAVAGLHILELPITSHPRIAGQSSLARLRLLTFVVRALGQTLSVARRFRGHQKAA